MTRSCASSCADARQAIGEDRLGSRSQRPPRTCGGGGGPSVMHGAVDQAAGAHLPDLHARKPLPVLFVMIDAAEPRRAVTKAAEPVWIRSPRLVRSLVRLAASDDPVRRKLVE